jgi:hypothetical protein
MSLKPIDRCKTWLWQHFFKLDKGEILGGSAEEVLVLILSCNE